MWLQCENTLVRNHGHFRLNFWILFSSVITTHSSEVQQQLIAGSTSFTPKDTLQQDFLKLLQDQMEKENTDGMFLFLDMEKAFDRVSWEFLLEGLRSLGFGTPPPP